MFLFVTFYFISVQFVSGPRTGFESYAAIAAYMVLTLNWVRFFVFETPGLRFLSWLGILVSIGVSGLPIDVENPFTFFSGSLFINLLGLMGIVAQTIFTDEKDNISLANRIIFWVPLIFLVGINSFFILLNYRELMAYDTCRHAANAVAIYQSLAGDGAMKMWEAITYYDFYQPYSYIIPAPFLMFFGVSYTSLNMVQCLFWLPLGYWAVFKTLRFLRFGHWVSVLVAFICFSGTLATSLTRHFMQDLCVLTMLLWFQYFLLRSGFLKHKKMTLLTGLFFGLGLLTKSNFLVLGLGSFIGLFGVFLNRKSLLAAVNRVDRLVWFLLPVILTMGFWYLVNKSHYEFTLPGWKNWSFENNIPEAEAMASWFWYWPSVPHLGGMPFFILFLAGFLWAIWKNNGIRWPLFFGLPAAFFAIAIMSTIPTKDQRTIFPILAFMIIPVGYLFHNGRKMLTFPIIGLVISFYMVRLFAQTFDWKLPLGLTPNPFSVFSKPLPPSVPTPNLSYFTYKKLMAANFVEENIPELQCGQEVNYHTKLAFSLMIPEVKTHFPKRKGLESENVFFTKSDLWPDHFLWGVEKEGDFLVLKDLGRIIQITADHVIRMDWLNAEGVLIKTDEAIMELEAHSWKYTIPAGSTKVRIYLRMHYAHPRGQWVKLVYDLLQNPEFHYFDIYNKVFQPNGEPTIYYDFNLVEK